MFFVCPECGTGRTEPGACAVDGTIVARVDDPLIGAFAGAYRITRLIGAGGMGRVYRAVHPAIGSRVAIKVLSRECADRPELVERFFAEARAVNVVQHEAIVNVIDLARLPDGRPYIVMEYLDGAPLSAVISAAARDGRRLPIGGIARLIGEVLDALAAAHSKGIVHRDLKPDNLFVTPSGRPKVLDFGIAKLSDASAVGSGTRTGALLGTPHYMAPEQAAGRAVDHRADVYAIGVILFELVTGSKPFDAPVLYQLLRMHIETAPPSLRTLRPEIGVDLEQVILCALAKDADHRFANAHALNVALAHATSTVSTDQWAQILPPGVIPGAVRQPTPPASWAERAVSSGHPPPPHLGATTASGSAGEITKRRSGPARRAAVLAVTGLVLVGGGVTAGVVATRRSAPASAPAPVAAPATPVGDPGTPPAADPWSHVGSTAPPPSVPPTAPPVAEPGLTAEQIDALFEARLAKVPKAERAKLRAQLGEIKKMGALPQDQQLAKILEMQELVLGDLEGQLANAFDISGAQAPNTTSNVTASRPPPAVPAGQLGPDEWITLSPAPIGGLDRSRVDATKFVTQALTVARAKVPDVTLTRIDFEHVDSEGRVDLGRDGAQVDVRMISPARAKVDKSPHERCELRVMVDHAEPTPYFNAMSSLIAKCKTKTIRAPRCSAKQVWAKALVVKPELRGELASLGYRFDVHGNPVWYFDVQRDGEKLYDARFPDDC